MNSDSPDKWRELVRKVRAQDDEEVVFRPGASEASLELLENALGFRFPEEFHEFYRECDGAGTPYEGEEGWFFMPIAKIQAFGVDSHWMAETHPEIAARYVPFIDWGTGDNVGYLFDESGKLLPGLYEFEHDDYTFDPEQDWREFLQSHDDSIENFLLTCL